MTIGKDKCLNSMYCLYQTSNFANPERPSFRVCHSKLVNIKYLKSKRAALKNHKRILKVGSTSIYIYSMCMGQSEVPFKYSAALLVTAANLTGSH